MLEGKPLVLKILFRTDKNGSSWIDRSKICSNPHIQKLFTQEEWKKFCDNVDFSLNPHQEPELKRATKEENKKDALKRLGKCLMWSGIGCIFGCCLVICVAGDNAGRADKHVVQPAQIRACMDVLDKESKKRSNVLFQLVIDGIVTGGGYIQHIKCTITDSIKVVEKFNDDV